MRSNKTHGKLAPEADAAGAGCPACQRPVDALRARHLAVVAGRVVPFCSAECRDRGAQPPAPTIESVAPVAARKAARWLLMATPLVIMGGVLLGARISIYWRAASALPSTHAATVSAPAVAPSINSAAVVGEPEYGPEPPPPEYLEVDNDRWLHPLPGPVRRLPERPTRRFGAGRDHDSPDSCGGGHCGVDVGELRGESVLAVHDGVVERVVRTEGEDRGGKYVRLLHFGGRVVTQYMHLEKVSDQLQPGMHVRAGEVLGTVGDSGTKNSGPHLHFTFATRASESAPEVYVDPLALLTVWPLLDR